MTKVYSAMMAQIEVRPTNEDDDERTPLTISLGSPPSSLSSSSSLSPSSSLRSSAVSRNTTSSRKLLFGRYPVPSPLVILVAVIAFVLFTPAVVILSRTITDNDTTTTIDSDADIDIDMDMDIVDEVTDVTTAETLLDSKWLLIP